jgi:hypothetical protein
MEYTDLDPRPFEDGIAPEPEEIEEYCPFCDNNVAIMDNRITRCPDCGQYLRPCCGCSDNDHPCDWSMEKGCWRFPFPSPLETGMKIKMACGTKGVIVEYDCEDDGDDLSQFRAYHIDFGGEAEWEIVYHGEIVEFKTIEQGKPVWLKNYADAWLVDEVAK